MDEIKCHLLDRGEYGEFFPWSFSPVHPFASCGLMYLIDDADVEKLGGMRVNMDSAGALGHVSEDVKMKSPNEIPDRIEDMDPNAWANVSIFDEQEKRRFAFLAPEIELYKELGIGPSKRHPMLRLRNLLSEANSGVFVDASCAKCGKALVVSKNATYPNRKIYCREDYLKHLEQYG